VTPDQPHSGRKAGPARHQMAERNRLEQLVARLGIDAVCARHPSESVVEMRWMEVDLGQHWAWNQPGVLGVPIGTDWSWYRHRYTDQLADPNEPPNLEAAAPTWCFNSHVKAVRMGSFSGRFFRADAAAALKQKSTWR